MNACLFRALFHAHPFKIDKRVVSCNRMSTLVAPSGECLRGEGLLWFLEAVVCSLAAAEGPIVR